MCSTTDHPVIAATAQHIVYKFEKLMQNIITVVLIIRVTIINDRVVLIKIMQGPTKWPLVACFGAVFTVTWRVE